jgi:hypothetical protein
VGDALSTLFAADVFMSSSALRIVGGSGLTDGTGDDDRAAWLGEFPFYCSFDDFSCFF